jgi:hypothetical protein
LYTHDFDHARGGHRAVAFSLVDGSVLIAGSSIAGISIVNAFARRLRTGVGKAQELAAANLPAEIEPKGVLDFFPFARQWRASRFSALLLAPVARYRVTAHASENRTGFFRQIATTRPGSRTPPLPGICNAV